MGFEDMSKQELQEAQSKGGKNVTRKRMLAAKLAGMRLRARNLDDEDHDTILECMSDPDASIYQLEKTLDECQHKMSAKDYMTLKAQIHKMAHGEKKQVDINLKGDVQINIGVDMSAMMPQVIEPEVIDVEPEKEE